MGQPFRDEFELQKQIENLTFENNRLAAHSQELHRELDDQKQKFALMRNMHAMLMTQIKALERERRILWVIAFTCLALMLLQGVGEAFWRRLVE